MLTLRQRAIIDILQSEARAMTGRALAQLLGVSDRTIRSDIEEINRQFDCEFITASHRNGYRLEADLYKTYQTARKDPIPQTAQQRCLYLIKELLFHAEEVNLIALQNQVFVSGYSIDGDIRKIRAMIREFSGLRLVRSKNHLRLEGEEGEKRRLYKKLLTRETEGNFINLSAMAGIWQEFDLLEIKDAFEEICQHYGYHIPELVYPMIMLHAGVSVERMLHENFVEDTTSDPKLWERVEYKIADELFARIAELYPVPRVEDEVYRFAELLMRKNNLYDNDCGEDLDALIHTILQTIRNRFEIDFSRDEEFVSGIISHVRLLRKRLKQQADTTNPYLPEIKWRYPLVFEMAVEAANSIEEYTQCRLNEQEICYLALHLGVAYERSNVVPRFRVVLIAPNSYVTITQQCVDHLVQRFGNRVELVRRYNLFDERKIVQDDPQLILSTVPLKHDLEIPTIHISLFVSGEDESRIFQALNRLDRLRYHHDFVQRVRDLLRPELFYIRKRMEDSRQAITFLCDRLQAAGLDDGSLAENVHKRESYAATSFVQGFAIPHAMGGFVQKTSISILLLQEPLKWGVHDVRLVVLLGIREHENQVLKVFLDWLFHIVTNHAKFEELISSESFEEFRDRIISVNE